MYRLLSIACLALIGTVINSTSPGQTTPSPAPKTGAVSAEPADPKAKQTFEDAVKLLKKHEYAFALDGFRKADKQFQGCTGGDWLTAGARNQLSGQGAGSLHDWCDLPFRRVAQQP
jgi:hypothetical protein